MACFGGLKMVCCPARVVRAWLEGIRRETKAAKDNGCLNEGNNNSGYGDLVRK